MNIGFLSAVQLSQYLTGSTKWRKPRRFILVEDLVYVRPCGIRYTVPAGFLTDGPSFIPMRQPWLRAAVLHDYLYTRRDLMDRKDADIIFKEAMKWSGTKAILYYIIYLGVRIGGHRRYRQYKNEQQKGI